MFFSKKKKRKRFLCLRILCFFGIKGNYSVPQTVMSNYLNTTICFDLYGRIFPIRPERAEALSPGQRPGLLWMQGCRPVRAKALCIAWEF